MEQSPTFSVLCILAQIIKVAILRWSTLWLLLNKYICQNVELFLKPMLVLSLV